MAVMDKKDGVTSFEEWYVDYQPTGSREGCLDYRDLADCANHLWRRYDDAKREMDSRVANYDVLEKLADGEVISPKPDLPNVSSGETAGLIRRTARNLVQNTPNVEIIARFDDDSWYGKFADHILRSKIIGSDHYSNDMQQNLFASTKTSLTLGFDAVIPVLLKNPVKGWHIKYDAIHYRDVFPEAGVKDVRDSDEVFIRRYLTAGDVRALIRNNAPGWDVQALKRLALNPPPARAQESTPHQEKKHRKVPNGYEIITWYSNTGEPFLTFEARSKMLLRIEKNKHPQKRHPVHFLVLEKDAQQPLGKSQVELLIGRQDFQDLMLNGAMKLWYRNINPSIIGYGAANAVPNLSPGKYTSISNPNAKVEPFEVNTGTLMQYGTISQQNLGSMVNMLGTADQQMATQAGNGMSATPQGVEAQQTMVDITTNNYQKAIEGFFSHYCSYALTIYFAELAAVKSIAPTAEARMAMLKTGIEPDKFNEDGTLDIDFSKMVQEYFVRCVPGSLTEMEDEKQLRILNQLFVPLSQAMPALASTQNPQMIGQAAVAMSYIIQKQIELSGASDAMSIKELWTGTAPEVVDERDQRIGSLEERLNDTALEEEREAVATGMAQMQEQMSLLTQTVAELMNRLGVMNEPSGSEQNSSVADSSESGMATETVLPASA